MKDHKERLQIAGNQPNMLSVTFAQLTQSYNIELQKIVLAICYAKSILLDYGS